MIGLHYKLTSVQKVLPVLQSRKLIIQFFIIDQIVALSVFQFLLEESHCTAILLKNCADSNVAGIGDDLKGLVSRSGLEYGRFGGKFL